MLTKLKKCKTLKEIYEVLGRIFFEKIAMYIVMGWCLLPILSIFFHIRWMGMAKQTFMYGLSYVQCIRLINILQYLGQSTDMKVL